LSKRAGLVIERLAAGLVAGRGIFRSREVSRLEFEEIRDLPRQVMLVLRDGTVGSTAFQDGLDVCTSERLDLLERE
jgi:hypothetical protein